MNNAIFHLFETADGKIINGGFMRAGSNKLTIILSFFFVAFNFLWAQNLQDGLVAYFPFTGGSVDDFSGNNLHATNYGAEMTTDRFGNTGNALSFKENEYDYLSVEHNNLLNFGDSYSFSFFVKIPEGGEGYIYNKGINGWNPHISGYINESDKFYAEHLEPGTNHNTTTEYINDWTWKNITVIKTSTDIKIYVNGKLESTYNASAIGSANNESRLYFGRNNDHSVWFTGVLDDIRIYNRELTETEISLICNEGDFTPDLIAYFPFDGNAHDETVYQNHASVPEATLTTDRFGNYEKAYDFDEVSGSYIPNNYHLNQRELTYSFWVNFDELLEKNSIIRKLSLSWNQYHFYVEEDKFQLRISSLNGGSIQHLISESSITLNKWYHIAFTIDENNGIKLYIDGVIDAFNPGALTGWSHSGSSDITIAYKDTWYNFDGKLDDIRIYDNILTEGQISELYHENAYYMLSAPNGGEIYNIGENVNIEWERSNFDYVKIDYSTDRGDTWLPVADNIDMSAGSYGWTVPSTPTSLGLVRISNQENPSVFDISDEQFYIHNNGQQIFEMTDIPAGPYKFGQTAADSTLDHDFQLMINHVTNAQYVVYLNRANETQSIYYNSSNKSIYSYTQDTLFAKIPDDGRIHYDGTNFTVESEFENHPAVNISWFGADAFSKYYGMRLPSEFEWEKAARGIQTNNYPWNSNTVDGSWANYLNSDDPWEPGTSPVGIYNGQTYNDFITNNAASPYGIMDMTGNVYDWTATNYSVGEKIIRGGSWNSSTSVCPVWVRSNGGVPIVTTSFYGFRCAKEIEFKLTNPNGGEIYNVGTQTEITWSEHGVENIKLEISTDFGSSWEIIENSFPAASGTYSWTVQNTPTSLGLVRITNVDNPNMTDISDEQFYIHNNGQQVFEMADIEAGDYLFGEGDTLKTLDYDYQMMVNHVTNAQYVIYLEAAKDQGTIIATTTSVQNLAGQELLDLDGECRITYNGSGFEIESGFENHPVVEVTWYGANDFAIQNNLRLPDEYEWEKAARGMQTADYPWGTDNIDGSWANYQDSGDPWDNGTTPVGFYNGQNYMGFQTNDAKSPYGVYDMAGNVFEWTSSINFGNYYVLRGGAWNHHLLSFFTVWYRVGDPPTNSFLNFGFRCALSSNIELTSPNGGEIFQAGEQTQITWTQNGVENIKIEYSSDKGTSWEVVSDSYDATLGSYNWAVPETPTSLGLIRLTNVDNPNMTDISDEQFYIHKNGQQVFEMADIPAGDYLFGEGDTLKTLDYDYQMMVNHVTNAQYVIFLEAAKDQGKIIATTTSVQNLAGQELLDLDGDCRISYDGQSFSIEESYENHPVIELSYFGAEAFTEFYGLRLPTEFEWEKAARGMQEADYPWNSNIIDGTYANYKDSGDPWDNGTSPVGYFNGLNPNTNDAKSAYGLYDMAGNVLNWTINDFDPENKVFRGSSWDYDQSLCTVWFRSGCSPLSSRYDYGFRCVKESSIKLTIPNGGETLQAGDITQVTWTGAGSNYIQLQYSTNSGDTWNTFISSLNGSQGSFDWHIPNTPSTECLVRAFYRDDPVICDTSDATFSINGTTMVDSFQVVWGMAGADYTAGMINCSDGGYAVTGNIKLTGREDTDLYICKTDMNGILIWEKIFGEFEFDYGMGITEDQDGNLIVVGLTDFENENDKMYLIKIASDGQLIWEKYLGSEYGQLGRSIISVEGPAYVISGSRYINSAVTDVLLMKVDTSGSVLWSKTYTWQGDYSDNGYIVKQTPDNGYIIGASLGSGGNQHVAMVIKTQPDGTEDWKHSFEGNYTWINDIDLTPDGGYVFVGMDGNTPGGHGRAYIEKLNSDGYRVWHRFFGPATITNDYFGGVKVTADGEYLLAGYTGTFSQFGGLDAWLVKINRSGELIWENFFGGEFSDASNSSIYLFDNNTCVFNSSYGKPDPDQSDFYLVKTDFPIIPNPIITSPNGGEILQSGDIHQISWTNAGSGNYTIEYRLSDDVEWIPVTSSAQGGTFNWMVPNTTGNECRIRITNNDNAALIDTSYSWFYIHDNFIFDFTNMVTVDSGAFTWGQNDETKILPYDYEMMNRHITNAEYVIFLRKALSENKITINGNDIKDLSGNLLLRKGTLCAIEENSGVFSIKPGYENHPVTQISWYGSKMFCDEYGLRLPNDMEWEKAARANTGSDYPWGDTTPDGEYANYNGSGDPWEDEVIKTTPSKFFNGKENGEGFYTQDAASPYGIYDLAGNVWSWTSTKHNNQYRRLRGGSWQGQAGLMKSWHGSYDSPGNVGSYGFRGVKSERIRVVSPNGGEIFQVGQPDTIRWISADIYLVNIEYSANGGQHWSMVGQNIVADTGYFSWTMPDSASSESYIRVTSVLEPELIDMSDAQFYIHDDGQLGFSYINIPAGEFSSGDTTKNLPYEYKIMDRNITNAEYMIFLEKAKSTGLITISSGQVKDTQSRVLTNLNLAYTAIDFSNNKFSIKPGYVNHPVMGLTWYGANAFAEYYGLRLPTEDEWEKASRGDDGRIYPWGNEITGANANYSGSGDPWEGTTIPTTPVRFYNGQQYNGFQTSASESYYGLYDMAGNVWEWTSTDEGGNKILKGGSYLVPPASLVSSYRVATTPADLNIYGFRLVEAEGLQVTHPAGGEMLEQYEPTQITWQSSQIQNVKIELSTNNGTTWSVLAESVPAAQGSYNWIPTVLSAEYLVRISAVEDPAIFDLSNSTFTVFAQYVTVITPNGGGSWEVGDTETISWESAELNMLKIELSTDNGTNWIVIGDSVSAALGSHQWKVTNVPSTQCLVKITDKDGADESDVSDAVFTIKQPLINVTAPTAGQQINVNDPVVINWQIDERLQAKGRAVENVRIELTTDGEVTWDTLTASIPASAGTYSWDNPDNILSDECKVKIIDTEHDDIYGLSGYFQIVEQNLVAIITADSIWMDTNLDGEDIGVLDSRGTIVSGYQITGRDWYINGIKSLLHSDTLEVSLKTGTNHVKVVVNTSVGVSDSAEMYIDVYSYTFTTNGEIYSGVCKLEKGDDDVYFLSSTDGKIYKIDSLGTQLQYGETDASILSTLAITSFTRNGSTLMHVGSDDNKIHCFNENCVPIADKGLGDMIQSSPTISHQEHTIYIGVENENLSAKYFDSTLAIYIPNWDFQTRGPVKSSPAVIEIGSTKNYIYFGSMGNPSENDYPTFYILEDIGVDKNLIKEMIMDEYTAIIFSSPAIYQDENDVFIYFTTGNGYLYKVNIDGTQYSKVYIEGANISSSPVIGKNDIVYVATENGLLLGYEFDFNSNSLRAKSYVTGSAGFTGTPAIGKDGKIYIGDKAGRFYAFEDIGEEELKLIWYLDLDGTSIEAPTLITESGLIFIGALDGNVYIMRDRNYVREDFVIDAYNYKWPTFKGDNMRNQVIQVPESIIMSIPYDEGWNMTSVPLLSPDMSVENIYPAPEVTTTVYKFDNGYVAVDTTKNGEGYWVKFNYEVDLNYSGYELNDTIDVKMGWNMIGPFSEPVAVETQINSIPDGIIGSSFYGFSSGYDIADTLHPGRGYWIKVTEDGQIVFLTATENPISKITKRTEVDKKWGKLIICDNAGDQKTLYSSDRNTNIALFELPPLPPAEIFDARFGNNGFAAMLNDVSEDIHISSVNYPVTIRIEGLNAKITDKAGTFAEVIRDGGEFVLSDPNIKTLSISAIEIPVDYVLMQNYPNPFNPETTIQFGLPEETRVEIIIYDMLGQKVETLHKGNMLPGYHKLIFDGAGYASGTYIYEMRTSAFGSVKKMLLIK